MRTVKLDLTDVDGNAYFIIGAFRRQAKREGWPQDEIEAVCTEAAKGDYDHLLQTIIQHCE